MSFAIPYIRDKLCAIGITQMLSLELHRPSGASRDREPSAPASPINDDLVFESEDMEEDHQCTRLQKSRKLA